MAFGWLGDRREAAKQFRRQMQRLDARMRADDHEPLDQIAQLAHVSRPGVTRQHGQRRIAEFLGSAAVGGAEFGEEMARQAGNVLDAFAQGGHREGNHVEAIEKVLPEQAAAMCSSSFLLVAAITRTLTS